MRLIMPTLALPSRVAQPDLTRRFCRLSLLRGRSLPGVQADFYPFTTVESGLNWDGSECDGSYRLGHFQAGSLSRI
ncbi:hypothetical protein chiPu_0021311 [Chiloscyllium punctatum]|uniref:Uncharacterized protein n=1 Tax=Chiloscyllium punctatum TaxID=137246 RepID=A0A401RQ10_CHIPU|nr:hypothetical protein [Chiloscyllium punctatum]